MPRLRIVTAVVALLLVMSAGGALTAAATTEGEPTERELLDIDPANFDRSTTIDNEWWPLEPGTRLVYEGFHVDENGERIPHRVVDTVTDVTKVINGVRTVVSLEEDYTAGELIEREIAFHAQDNDGNVWHLGQLRETYDDVEFVGGRVWLVGHLEGAHAGIRMLAEPGLGASYSQGYAPPPFHWTDRARVYQMGQQTTVPTGSYEDVLVIEEWDEETPEGVFQLKYYARGVGVVRIGFRGPDPEQEEMELVKIEQLDLAALAEARAEVMRIEERAYIYAQTPPAE